MNDPRIPTLRIELDAIRENFISAYMTRTGEIEKMVAQIIEAELTPEVLQRHIQEEVRNHLGTAIRKQVKSFFDYGDGHRYVQGIVEAVMKGELGIGEAKP